MTATCPAGTTGLSGGYQLGAGTSVNVSEARLTDALDGFTVTWANSNSGGVAAAGTVNVLCVTV